MVYGRVGDGNAGCSLGFVCKEVHQLGRKIRALGRDDRDRALQRMRLDLDSPHAPERTFVSGSFIYHHADRVKYISLDRQPMPLKGKAASGDSDPMVDVHEFLERPARLPVIKTRMNCRVGVYSYYLPYYAGLQNTNVKLP